ncbi:MAG TPA: glycosyltransferase family 2 protein, partial [Terriglobales bacterium]|nr:glycosyltransferase family 2 protein [Terriglobales bacterium]
MMGIQSSDVVSNASNQNSNAGTVSVIIVNYNTQGLLRGCLSSLARTAARITEMIVVDNASSDGSPEMVEKEFPGVILIRNQDNVGFSKANNQGIQVARGSYIWLLNSDTIVRPGTPATMAEFLDAKPAVSAVTCKLLNADGSIQASISNRPGPVLLFFRLTGISRLISKPEARRWLVRSFGFFLGRTVRAYLAPYVTGDSPVEVESISGACLMLRRKAIANVGLLDERFFMYFEDMDYCLRLRNAGLKLYYLPHGEIVHLVGKSSGGRMRDYSIHSYRAMFYFYRKHFSYPMLFAARAMVVSMSSL